MISDIANKFQEITKFDLYSFFIDYADFMRNQYQEVRSYYAGETDEINSEYINNLNSLIVRSDDLMKLFNTFGPKLGNVGFWELQNYCQDLSDTIKKVSILPKYLRTSKTPRGNYRQYIQVNSSVGGMVDFKDIADRLNSDDISDSDLILSNDFEEEDYEIDELTNAKMFYPNSRNGINVKTILEEPVGSKIYGKDLSTTITFTENGDLATAEYRENVEQKVVTLLQLKKGDIPEMPQLGRKKIIGENFNNYSYPELARDLRDVFLQDDLFESVEFEDIYIKEGDIFVTLNIRTKYVYATKRTIRI